MKGGEIMDKQEQILNWLVAAFKQREDSLTEMFFFDKRDNQFFSVLFVLFIEYFMLDENFDLAKDVVSTNYSKETLALLIDRIKRIEKFDHAIIAIPRLSLTDTLEKEDVVQKAETFLNLNQINIQNVSIWEIEEASVSIDLTKDSKVKKRKYWWWPW
jgi:hypothetical protein